MERKKSFSDRLQDNLDLPGEALPGVPVMELAGDRRVLIENHGGVTEYGTARIRVRVSYGEACICGTGLELTRMTRQQIVVSGRIDSVTLHRGRNR